MTSAIEALSDAAAERAVLAGVFRYGADAYLDIADIVTSNTFTMDVNQPIWMCIEHIFREDQSATSLDYATIMSAAHSLKLTDIFNSTSNQQHLRALSNFPVKQENVLRMSGKIRRLEVGRLLTEQLDEAKSRIYGITGDESVGEIMSMAEEPIFDLTSLLTCSNEEEGIVQIGYGARERMEYLADNPREMMGISTGMSRYDNSIGGGVRPNSLDIIAARPKTGKTFLVDNMGVHIAEVEEVPVFNLDTEMDLEQHQDRILANLAGKTIYDIETGKFGKSKLSRKEVLDATDRLNAMPYMYQAIRSKSFEEVLASLRRWVTRTVGLESNGKAKPCIVLYDYLKLLSADFGSSGRNMQEHQALGYITTGLKNFMGRYGVGCVAFAQLNRDGIEKEDTSVISGADRIIHYCTSFSIFKRFTDEERKEHVGESGKYTHKLRQIIGRHGAGLKDSDYINVECQYEKGRIIEGPTKFELAYNQSPRSASKGFEVGEIEDDSIDATELDL